MSFIETANLDGETNLKIRQAHPDTASLLDTVELMNFRANIQCEPPNRQLYEFNGVLRETNKQYGCFLQKFEGCYEVVCKKCIFHFLDL